MTISAENKFLINNKKINIENFRSQVKQEFPKIQNKLENLIKIPGIAWEAFPAENLQKSAQKIIQYLEELDLDEINILHANKADSSQKGAPAVVAKKFPKPGYPTVLLYAHHDVQPPGNKEQWESDPFTPTIKNGRLYGRGAADDKAGVLAHIAALNILQKTYGEEFGLGITFFIEGEEEAGSPSLRNFLEKYQQKLDSDVIIVADSANWAIGTPALTTSLRGVVSAVFELEVLDHSVHSGVFGGPVLDALTIMSKLVSTFHDEKGNVAIAGLHNSGTNDLIYEEKSFRTDSSVLPNVQLCGEGSITERLWQKPAFSIIGIDAPSVALASNTLIPKAAAKFSLRVAPEQNVSQALQAVIEHVKIHAPFGVEVKIKDIELGQGFQAKSEGKAAKIAASALSAAWGNQAVNTGLGGSIPFIADLKAVYPDAEILITGVEDPDSRAHSANESLHLGEYENAILGEILLLAGLCFEK